MKQMRMVYNSDSPIRRVREVGPEATSISELVAVITGITVANASQLVGSITSVSDLMYVSRDAMAEFGITPDAFTTLTAALELGKRMVTEGMPEQYNVRDPGSISRYLSNRIGFKENEHFIVIWLDTRNNIIGSETLYVGTINMSQVRTAEVFRAAIRHNAASIIVAHNHPSGNLTPSPEDIELTQEIIRAGKLLQVALLDHIVIGRSDFVSMREHRLVDF